MIVKQKIILKFSKILCYVIFELSLITIFIYKIIH